jgi:hypothetical protein
MYAIEGDRPVHKMAYRYDVARDVAVKILIRRNTSLLPVHP